MSGYPQTAIDAFVAFVKSKPEGFVKSDDLASLYSFSSEIKEIRSTGDWKPTIAVKQSNGRLKTIPSTDPNDIKKNIFKFVFVEPVLGGGGQAPVVVPEVVVDDPSSAKAESNREAVGFTQEQTEYGDQLYDIIRSEYPDNISKIVGIILYACEDDISQLKILIKNSEDRKQFVEDAYKVLNS